LRLRKRTRPGVDQRGDGRVTAQPVQAAGAARPDAADSDAQLGTDLRIGHGRVFDQQGDQLPTAGGQVGERLAQRDMALGRQHLLLGCPGVFIGEEVGVQHRPGR
jgi:hypothetical protein